VPFTLVHPEK